MKKSLFLVGISALLFIGGCRAVQTVDRASPTTLEQESTIVFSRPSRYSIWGTRSMRELFEITYERFSHNQAGQPVLEVGLRYSGTTNWYDWGRKMPQTVTVMAKTTFYPGRRPHSGAPVYATNNQTLTMRLGDVVDYKAICPRKTAQGYQLVLSAPVPLQD